ncbi:CDP-diacylglycerol--glycerol-3-phosphate 3-phosphatidyltransferase, mitochondrial isoform X1 [Frieseomelitta varia]|uniref:CDP-diacylglycerol--glycerol-3-phosphate 3-phosphatidyltransferase, mitochondrial isoform X1 n=1 Tax=Frieseomelitta varia TaxID=561572 RepID=UPI001CB6930B|nr:CDP-diacylglycerol--glycerol-3-phosphate 3-phosphatidyltransferase, mitochondrial isoform X1 [Frieseomelitta varia]
MHSVILKTVKRFHTRKLLISIQPELKFSSSPISKNITSITMTMTDEEKDLKLETIQSEFCTLTWLYKSAPCFPVNGSKIKIIHEPNTFYSTLVQKCKNARKRITLASLYLGTGKLESSLVNVVNEALIANNGNVEVKILLDFMRGSRGKLNSRKMLEPLLNGKYGHCCQIFLYHTPKLRGFLKMIIPDRFNELIGLQHMKLYMIDNDIIISGANLSTDYFINKQDRYFLIEDCKELCDFYDELVRRVGEFSFVLQSDGTVSSAMKVNPIEDPISFIKEAAHSVKTLFQRELGSSDPEKIGKDTWIFPLVQMGQLNIYHDSQITLRLLQTAPEGATLKLATGYFNLTSEYSKALLEHCQGTCHLLTAHPTTNSFFTAKGIANSIPAAYTKIEESFVKYCNKLGQQDRVILWEFIKPGWIYHAKGLWYSLPNQEKPCLTLIGSPNFGYRSVNKDLETQIAIITKNRNLQNELQKEQERLFLHAQRITNETFSERNRVPPSWVCAIVVLFRYYF